MHPRLIPDSVQSAVENGVGPHDADDLPCAVTVLVLHLFMEEVQISCKKHVELRLYCREGGVERNTTIFSKRFINKTVLNSTQYAAPDN